MMSRLMVFVLLAVVFTMHCSDLGGNPSPTNADFSISPSWYSGGDRLEGPDIPDGAVVRIMIVSSEMSDTIRSSFEYGNAPEQIEGVPVGIQALFAVSMELPDGEVLFVGEKMIFETAAKTDVAIELHRIPPRSPGEFDVKKVGMGVVSLSWNDSSSMEHGFVMERMLSGEASFTERVVLDSNKTSFLDTIAYKGVVQYRLSAFNAAGRSSPVDGELVFSGGAVYVTEKDTFSVREDSSIEISRQDLFLNDTLSDPVPLTLELVCDSDKGTVDLIVKDLYRYTPSPDFFGRDSLRYRLLLDDTVKAEELIIVEVHPEEDPPIALADSGYSVKQDSVLRVSESQGLLANDFDPDEPGKKGYEVLFLDTGSVQYTQGDLKVNRNGSFIYTPPEGFLGKTEFFYKVLDSTGLSSESVRVTVSVTEKDNHDPVSHDDTFTVQEEDSLIDESVLLNDIDEDGMETVVVILIDSTENGRLDLGVDGMFSYYPSEDFYGVDSFSYKLKDDQNAYSEVSWVHIGVENVNDIPEALSDAYITPEDTAVTCAVLENDTDADGDSLEVLSAQGARNGELDIDSEKRSVVYTPERDFFGQDTFEYSISDGCGGTDSAQVIVTVEPRPDKPGFVDAGKQIDIYEGDLWVDTVRAFDPDGTVPDISVRSINPEATWITAEPLAGALVIRAEPSHSLVSSEPRLFTVKLQASDGQSEVVDSLCITVINRNLKPEVDFVNIKDGDVFAAGKDVSFGAQATDSDGEVECVKVLKNGTFLFADSAQPYEFTIPTIEHGVHTLRVQAHDNNGDSTCKELEIKTGRWIVNEPSLSLCSDKSPGYIVDDQGNHLMLQTQNSHSSMVRLYSLSSPNANWEKYPSGTDGYVDTSWTGKVEFYTCALAKHPTTGEIYVVVNRRHNVGEYGDFTDWYGTMVLRRLNGGIWETVGDTIRTDEDLSKVTFQEIQLAFLPSGEPVVKYLQRSAYGQKDHLLKKLEGETWVEMPGPVDGATVTYLKNLGQKLFSASVNYESYNNYQNRLHEHLSGQWSPVGADGLVSDGLENVVKDLALDHEGNPWMAYIQTYGIVRGFLKQFDGSSWKTVRADSLEQIRTVATLMNDTVPLHLMLKLGQSSKEVYVEKKYEDGCASFPINADNLPLDSYSVIVPAGQANGKPSFLAAETFDSSKFVKLFIYEEAE